MKKKEQYFFFHLQKLFCHFYQLYNMLQIINLMIQYPVENKNKLTRITLNICYHIQHT
jgi:hypothetical protein